MRRRCQRIERKMMIKTKALEFDVMEIKIGWQIEREDKIRRRMHNPFVICDCSAGSETHTHNVICMGSVYIKDCC